MRKALGKDIGIRWKQGAYLAYKIKIKLFIIRYKITSYDQNILKQDKMQYLIFR